MLKLKSKIEDTFSLSKETIHILETYIDSDLIKDNISEKEIDPVVAEQYIGDMYGLLKNKFNLPSEVIYLTIRINDYKSSVDYDGNRKLKILKPEVFSSIYDLVELYLNKKY